MEIDVSKILDISARVAFAVCIATLLLLFFPSAFLPFDILPFREKYGFWIFLALAIALAMLVSYLGKWIVELIGKKIEKHKMYSSYKYVLKHMSKGERNYLKSLYEKRQTAVMLDLMDPIVKKLETFKVLSMAAGTSLAPKGMAPGFVQPWVFELLDKHPEYLEMTEEDAANA